MTLTKERYRVKELTYSNGKKTYRVERYQKTWATEGWVSYHDNANKEEAMYLRDKLNEQAKQVSVISEKVID